MRVPSGVTDQYIYLVAVDATDLKTRETGLTGFTVYRSRDGAAAAAMTTPTVNETDATNMPGVYELLLDEDTTIAAGNDSEEFVLHITQASMAPVTRVIELYRPKITQGYTLGVESDGDLTKVNALDGHTAQTGDNYVRIGANGAGLSALPWNSSWDSEVQSECTDALNVYDGPTNSELVAAFTEIKGATWASATDTLEEIRARGDTAWRTATSVTVSDKTGFSLVADQSGVTVGTINLIAGTIGTLDALDTAQDSQHTTTQANQTTILNRIGAFTGSGVNTVLGFLKASLSKVATNPSDLGGTYDAATDANEAIRDEGDTSWGSSGTNPNVLLTAEIAVVTDQTHFTLATGSTEDDAYKDQSVVLYDDTNSDYPSIRKATAYTGATKTLTIDSAPDFTLGADDSIRIFVTAPGATAPTTSENAAAVWGLARSGNSSAGSFGEGVASVQGNVTGSVGSVTGAAGSVTGNVGGNVTGSVGSVVGAVGSVTGAVGSVTGAVGSVTGSVGSIAGVSFPTNFSDLSITLTTGRVDVAAIAGIAQTANDNGLDINTLITQIGTAGNGLTAVPWNAAWDSEVQSECNDALTTIHLDHLFAVDYDPAAKPGVATALLNELIENDGGISRYTANALEQAPSEAAALATIDTVVDAIKVVTDNLPDSGALTSLATAASITTLNNVSTLDINSEIVDALTVDTVTQPGQGSPSANQTLALMVAYLYKEWRNKKDYNGTTRQLYNDGSTTVDQKRTTTESGGTVVSTEVTTGP